MSRSDYLKEFHQYSYGSHDPDVEDEVSENSDVSRHYTLVNDLAQEIDDEECDDTYRRVGITKDDWYTLQEIDLVSKKNHFVNKGKKSEISFSQKIRDILNTRGNNE